MTKVAGTHIIPKLSWLLPIFGIVGNLAAMSYLPPGKVTDIIRVSFCGMGFLGGIACGIIALFKNGRSDSDKKHAIIGLSVSSATLLLAGIAFVVMITTANPYGDIAIEVAEINKACPIKASEDDVLMGASFNNRIVTFTINMPNMTKDEILAVKDKANAIYMQNAEKIKSRYLVRGCSMEYVITDKNKNASLSIVLTLSGNTVVSSLKTL